MTGPDETGLTPATILAEAARVLDGANYHVKRRIEGKLDFPSERALLAEDKYGVVALVVYDTWSELASSWRSAQAVVVEAMSREYKRLDRKAWDGYLILLTPALATESDSTVHDIRYDTSRIRKLVATGQELVTLADVERVLLPLLPLSLDSIEVGDSQSLLDELPGHLERAGVARELADAAVEAFRSHRPIVQEIHRNVSGS